jgi:hypothetical protein
VQKAPIRRLPYPLLRRASFIRQGSEAEDGKTNHFVAARQQAGKEQGNKASKAGKCDFGDFFPECFC